MNHTASSEYLAPSEYINAMFGTEYVVIRDAELIYIRSGNRMCPKFSLRIVAAYSEDGMSYTSHQRLNRERFLHIRSLIYKGAFQFATITLKDYGTRLAISRTTSWHFVDEIPF